MPCYLILFVDRFWDCSVCISSLFYFFDFGFSWNIFVNTIDFIHIGFGLVSTFQCFTNVISFDALKMNIVGYIFAEGFWQANLHQKISQCRINIQRWRIRHNVTLYTNLKQTAHNVYMNPCVLQLLFHSYPYRP